MPPLVLVIDDDEDGREAYVHFLAAAGLRVRTAGSGTEALAAAREASPDLVVLDLGLPDLDGWEVTRRLRADPATRRAPCPPEDLVAEIRKRLAA